ncbi:MAG: hypothetical protein ACLRTD_24985 [Bacteroides sp.]
MVFKVSSLRQQRNLGYTAKSPRWLLRINFRRAGCDTFKFVSYQVGRTGTVTWWPILIRYSYPARSQNSFLV